MAAMMAGGQDLQCCCLVGFVDTVERSCGASEISHGGLAILTSSCDTEFGHQAVDSLAVVGT